MVATTMMMAMTQMAMASHALPPYVSRVTCYKPTNRFRCQNKCSNPCMHWQSWTAQKPGLFSDAKNWKSKTVPKKTDVIFVKTNGKATIQVSAKKYASKYIC